MYIVRLKSTPEPIMVDADILAVKDEFTFFTQYLEDGSRETVRVLNNSLIMDIELQQD